MMKLTVWLVMFFSCFPALGQQEDGLRQSSPASGRQESVLQSRRLLLEQFNANRLDSVSILLDSLDRQETPFLWPAERLLLYYWIERYASIDSLAKHFDTTRNADASNHPDDQTVWNVLSYHSLEKIDTLVSWIDQSGCTDDEFYFRMRLLETLAQGDWNDQASVNSGIAAFVSQHLLEEEQQQETTQVEVQAAVPQTAVDHCQFGFGMGLGPTSLSGKLSQLLSSKVCLSFDFNVSYRRWYFDALMQAVFATLKEDIPTGNGSTVWEAGYSADISNFGLSAGYAIVNRRWIKMSPFAGLLISSCAPSEEAVSDDAALRDAGIRWGYSTMFGWNTEIKLFNNNMQTTGLLFPAINVRLAYAPTMFNNINPRYSGSMFFLTFGLNLNTSSGW